tara:strand:+ start:376567 stop:379215 length:2649 start_codon:yes stop_codon:yes gene_type:complete
MVMMIPQRTALSVMIWALFFCIAGPATGFAQTSLKKPNPTAKQNISAVINAFNLGGCAGCHIIPGVPGADGEVGPDLSRLGITAATRRKNHNAKQYIRESIKNPDAFIAPEGTEDEYPAGVMLQSFAETLSANDLDLIVNYLDSLGKPAAESPFNHAPTQQKSIEVKLPVESNTAPLKASGLTVPSTAEVTLGRYLFHDKRLSANNSLSCANCHHPAQSWTDGSALSKGFPSTKLFRNTPSLSNLRFQKEYFLDGRIGDLPSVVRDHLTEAHFMASDGRLLVERLVQVPAYRDLFEKAYGGAPRFGRILNALTAYVTTLNSQQTPYDAFQAGQTAALSDQAQWGLVLFRGKAGCVNCHQEPTLTDQKFHNLDVPSKIDLLADPERAVTFRRFFRILGTPNYRNRKQDPGRESMTFTPLDRGKFRTPSLYEVAKTAPYMHNGGLKTLEEVVAFYNAGGGPQQTADLKPLNLTEPEQQALVAFLKSLSSKPVDIERPELPAYQLLPRTETAKQKQTKQPASTPANNERTFPPLTLLPAVPTPADNPLTPEKIELGRQLYFDHRMSADSSMSCNSCHPVTTGWTIQTPISMGGPGTSHWRNSQTILNVGYYGKLNWDGAKSSIESQNNGAWTGAVASNLDPTLGEERLAQIPDYVKQFQTIYGTDLPRWDDALRSVASFQRTINSNKTPFDRFLKGDPSALSPAAKRGHHLFQGKAGCISCHNGPLASDDNYYAIGVPQNPDFLTSPIKQITFRYELAAKGVPQKTYRSAFTDDGLFYVTKREADRGKFRTPSLRGLTHTAPYMHNGLFGTLEEVIDFYNTGGGSTANKSSLIRPLGLNEQEQSDLLAFLKSLSGKPIQIERPVLPEYQSAGLKSEGNRSSEKTN